MAVIIGEQPGSDFHDPIGLLHFNDARLWGTFLLNAFFFLTLSLGAVVFVCINRVANAGGTQPYVAYPKR